MFLGAGTFFVFAARALLACRAQSLPACRILPTDKEWPSKDTWDAFNQSVDGRLIRTVPIGSPCHDPTFDEQQCNVVRENWHLPEFHQPNPSSIMDPIFLNKSCDPFDSRDTPCRIGAYVQYAVNVSKPEHVVKTVQFVKDHNIRLVVKNTGHDYMGRSTGTGAVSVWMHHLTDVVWIPDYKSNQYSGPAFQVSAGVRGIDLVKVASLKGLAIVSGECPTVGFAGGYIQGGGHSALSSFYGLAADQSLEFEVITTEGQFLVASPTENEDLYWALSGGGGGTYGIVWSVTIKAHPDLPVTVAFLDFSSTGVSQEDYWAAIRSHSAATPAFSDSKVFSFTTITSTSFTMSPMFAVNKTTEQVTTLVEPIRQALDGLGMDFNLTIRTLDNYLDAYEAVASFANIPIANILSNTRLMPPSIWEDEITFNQYVDTLRTIINAGAVIVDTVLKPSLEVAGHPSNAVLPAWREISHMTMLVLPLVDGGPLDQITRDMDRITNQLDPLLVELAPDTGAYLNEADPNEPDFKRTFYGANYGRLLHIKDKYDPLQILYGSIAVGGDRWEEVENGRLCRTNRLLWSCKASTLRGDPELINPRQRPPETSKENDSA